MNSVVSFAAEFPVGARRTPAQTSAVLIPAYNEVATIDAVVCAARGAGLGRVLVVDDGSRDGTAERARRAGAEVLVLEHNLGKGGAVHAGLGRLDSDVIVLVDADLTGLAPEHLRRLAAPVLAGEVDMTRGRFIGGRWRTAAAQRITPQLNGQRAVRRELLQEVPGLAASRYGIEVAITEAAHRQGWSTRDVPLLGVSQVMKEEKRGFVQGTLTRLRMYWEIVRTLMHRPSRDS